MSAHDMAAWIEAIRQDTADVVRSGEYGGRVAALVETALANGSTRQELQTVVADAFQDIDELVSRRKEIGNEIERIGAATQVLSDESLARFSVMTDELERLTERALLSGNPERKQLEGLVDDARGWIQSIGSHNPVSLPVLVAVPASDLASCTIESDVLLHRGEQYVWYTRVVRHIEYGLIQVVSGRDNRSGLSVYGWNESYGDELVTCTRVVYSKNGGFVPVSGA